MEIEIGGRSSSSVSQKEKTEGGDEDGDESERKDSDWEETPIEREFLVGASSSVRWYVFSYLVERSPSDWAFRSPNLQQIRVDRYIYTYINAGARCIFKRIENM